MRVPSLGREDPLEEGLETHSGIPVWEIPWTEEPAGYSPWCQSWTQLNMHALIIPLLFSPVQLFATLDSSTPGFPVLHYLQKFSQTHVY